MPMTGDVEYGRGHRRREKKRTWQSDDEEEEPDEEPAGSIMHKNQVFALFAMDRSNMWP